MDTMDNPIIDESAPKAEPQNQNTSGRMRKVPSRLMY